MMQTHNLPPQASRYIRERLTAIQALQSQLQGSVEMYCRIHDLGDGWRLNVETIALERLDPEAAITLESEHAAD